jgi:DNA-binding beta-propeller fold protein YncE
MTRRHLLPIVILAGACQATSATPAGTPPAAQAAAGLQGTTEVVVANQQSASASILQPDGTMKHVSVGDGPHEAAVSPDGRIAVVTIYGTGTPGNRLAVLDLVGDTLVRTIDLGAYTRPHGVVFLGGSPNRIAVTSESTNNIVLVDLATGSIEPIGTEARGSHMVAVNAAGTRGWTADIAENTVTELDLTARRRVRSVTVPSRPEGIAVTPDGGQVWVGSNDTGEVTVMNGSTGRVIATLAGATFPYRLGASPDGRRMAVVDGRGDGLLIADVATQRYIGTIPLASPRGVAIAPDSRTAYVTQAGGTVAVVDIVDMRVLRTHTVQSSPDGVGTGIRR